MSFITKIIITVLRLFSSCPGIFKMSGKIVSNNTQNPIEGAQIELQDIQQAVHHNESYLSDKNGNFTASSTMRRMVFGLPKYRIKITKSGFHPLETFINLNGKEQENLFKLLEI